MKKLYIVATWFHDDNFMDTYNLIKTFGEWEHIAEDVWIVYTDKTPQEMLDAMLKVYKPTKNTRLTPTRFVAEINADTFKGFLAKTTWEWLEKVRNEIKENQNGES